MDPVVEDYKYKSHVVAAVVAAEVDRPALVAVCNMGPAVSACIYMGWSGIVAADYTEAVAEEAPAVCSMGPFELNHQ